MSIDHTHAESALGRLRAICLEHPEATELETWGDPTFRVRKKIFAMTKRGDCRHSLWCKARPGLQGALIERDPIRFFAPPYVGPKGWIGVRLDGPVDWDELQELIQDSFRMVAPKRLSALVTIDPLVNET